MIIHDLIQGADDWHQFRLDHDGASEAAAMLGLSPKVRRADLLRAKHTGLAREFGDWLQRNVLDKGHEVEALARPHVEAIVGEDLCPVTCSDGELSASCDGLTLGEDIAFEHKQWSESAAAIVNAGRVPDEHMPQCQQVLMVTGAERLIFVVSDGTPQRMAYVWVSPDLAWFQHLRDGWALFRRDLAAYELPESADPVPTGKAPQTLPALRIEVTGQITASNLAEFKTTALTAIRSVNRSLSTDADFADAEKAVKWCGDVESRLAAAKQHALSQTASIDALFKAVDDIATEARSVRLDLTKLVDKRKLEVREQAIVAARKALDAHVATLNAEIAPMRLPAIAADFAGTIKGKRTVASMQDALDGLLTVTKIAAEVDARAIRANLTAFKEQAAGFEFLFADLGSIVHKPADDFGMLVTARIDAEKRRRKEAADAEDALVTGIEAAAARIEGDGSDYIQKAVIAFETVARDWARDSRPRVAAAVAAGRKQLADKLAAARLSEQAAEPPVQSQQTPAPAVASVALPQQPAPAPRADEPATLNLTAICSRLGFTVSAQFLADTLHIQPAKVDRASKLYTERQFRQICGQIASHVSAMAELYAGETA